jgi:hypothetical protein
MGIDYNNIIVSDGLVFYIDAANPRSYSGTGLTANGLVGGIGATLINGVGFTSSNNGSFIFDGSDDRINLPINPSLDISESITLESFIYPTAYKNIGGPGSFIISKPDSYYLELSPEGKIRVAFISLSSEIYYDGNNTVPLNSWSHIVVTRDKNNSTINIYFNGTLDRSLSSITGNIKVQQIYAVMMGSFSGGDYQLFGRIANAKIYNRALSATEILQNYNATKGRYR